MSKSILTPIPLTPCLFIGQSDVFTRSTRLAFCGIKCKTFSPSEKEPGLRLFFAENIIA